jgi:predicted cation transporter
LASASVCALPFSVSGSVENEAFYYFCGKVRMTVSSLWVSMILMTFLKVPVFVAANLFGS